KVGDVLLLFWEWTRGAKNPLLMPVMIKWDYVGDDLIVQRLRQEKKPAGGYALTENLVSVLTAPDREPNNPRPPPPDPNCKFLCSCYYTAISHNTISRISSVFHTPHKNGPMRFIYEGDHMQLAFAREHFDQEWEWVRTVIKPDDDGEKRLR